MSHVSHRNLWRRPLEMPSDTKTVSLRYRPLNERVLSPQPIRLQVPGWAGETDKMVDGARPQPWHCRPYADAAVHGLELRYPGDAEYALSREAGALVLRKNGIPLPLKDGGFSAFSSDHYGVAFSMDIEVPSGFVLRVEPHPRFYTDRTGNVPAAIPGHIGPFWTQALFIVFKNPLFNGETHVFRPGLPYAQIFLVPEQAKYHAELMSRPDQHARSARVERVKEYASVNARFWTAKDERSLFDDKYKRLLRAYRAGGDILVEKEIPGAEERSRIK